MLSGRTAPVLNFLHALFFIYPLCLSIHSSPVTTTSITKSARGHIQERNRAQAKPGYYVTHYIHPLAWHRKKLRKRPECHMEFMQCEILHAHKQNMQKVSESNFTGTCFYFSVLNTLPSRKVFNSEEAAFYKVSKIISIVWALKYILVLKCPPLLPLLVCKFQALS